MNSDGTHKKVNILTPEIKISILIYFYPCSKNETTLVFVFLGTHYDTRPNTSI